MDSAEPIRLSGASVRVMHSHDYCHFEVALSTDEAVSDVQVDELRKRAARLVEKAVKQYKIAKANLNDRENAQDQLRWSADEIAQIEMIAEQDRTPEQKAAWKRYQDNLFLSNRVYDYDEW